MMVAAAGIEEYFFTAGILIAFLGTIASVVLSRKQIAQVLRGSRIKAWHIAALVVIAAVFLSAELAIVKPTQLLFFDDVIYQAGALDLLHMGQAWMCNFGTPVACSIGQVFHEPIGTSFTLAMGFGALGVHLGVAYGTMLLVTLSAVVITFLVATVLLGDPVAGLFSSLLLGLAPVVLVWARPTTSDMPMMAYSLAAIFLMLVFLKKKSIFTLSGAMFSASLVAYTKVDALLYLPLILGLYLILEKRGVFAKLVRKKALTFRVLLVVLLFVISVSPEAVYSYVQLTSGSYGYHGSYIQQSCTSGGGFIAANSVINLQNLEANACANIAFWADAYKNQYIMQPVFFTLLFVAGACIMFFTKRRAFLALLAWFGAFFLLYASFYGGGVTFGIDWRFMLALIAPASIFGGYAASLSYIEAKKRAGKRKLKVAKIAAYAAILVLIAYSIYSLGPLLGVQPSALPQAGDARFYESFVYNNSNAIPKECLVFSYDPTLFMINNRSAAQMSYLSQSSYQDYKSQYGCLVMDYGYWCYTPNNLCTGVENSFSLQSIVNATYQQKTFGFYYITGIKNSSS